MSNVDSFLKARNYLIQTIEPLVECYLTGIWDPHIKYVIIKETNKIINRDLVEKFPELNEKHLPRVKVRIHEEAQQTEISIQNYINRESDLTYLGSAGIGSELFDLYIRESYDPRFDYIFEARYGHDYNSYYSGAKTAEAEYLMGAITPLAIAYGMAVEDGLV